MTDTLEDKIINLVSTCTRDGARKAIGELLSHEFDKAYGDLLSTATHRIRKTTRPQNLILLNKAPLELLKSFGGKWFTTKQLNDLLTPENRPAPFETDPKRQMMTLSQQLAALYRAGHVEQRIVTGADVQRSSFKPSWAMPYSQTTYWRFVGQHEIETINGYVPPRKV